MNWNFYNCHEKSSGSHAVSDTKFGQKDVDDLLRSTYPDTSTAISSFSSQSVSKNRSTYCYGDDSHGEIDTMSSLEFSSTSEVTEQSTEVDTESFCPKQTVQALYFVLDSPTTTRHFGRSSGNTYSMTATTDIGSCPGTRHTSETGPEAIGITLEQRWVRLSTNEQTGCIGVMCKDLSDPVVFLQVRN
eukprot:GHVQ01017286.1.p1 GENE.GHVQ01017286.1~~GHVQ01017286.1.p1  ORF type:complete len:188 (+),score=12.05 GHVQ01017286.1:812-1375(+)